MISWNERVNMLSINPDAATRDDIATMAAELSIAKKWLVEITHVAAFNKTELHMQNLARRALHHMRC